MNVSPGPGRPKTVSLEFVRDLLGEDVTDAVKGLDRNHSARAPQRMRDSHHGAARAIASGMSLVEASRVTGFAANYLGLLKTDPSFIELVEFYRSENSAEQAKLRERLVTLALDISQEVQQRIIDAPETFSNGELRQFLTALADRTGVGPSSTVRAEVDVIEHLSYAEQRTLADALEALAREASGPIIEAEPVSPEEAPLLTLPGRGASPP